MIRLHSLLSQVKKGTRLPLREGGREKGGRSKQQIPPAVDFPQVSLVIIIMCRKQTWGKNYPVILQLL